MLRQMELIGLHGFTGVADSESEFLVLSPAAHPPTAQGRLADGATSYLDEPELEPLGLHPSLADRTPTAQIPTLLESTMVVSHARRADGAASNLDDIAAEPLDLDPPPPDHPPTVRGPTLLESSMVVSHGRSADGAASNFQEWMVVAPAHGIPEAVPYREFRDIYCEKPLMWNMRNFTGFMECVRCWDSIAAYELKYVDFRRDRAERLYLQVRPMRAAFFRGFSNSRRLFSQSRP